MANQTSPEKLLERAEAIKAGATRNLLQIKAVQTRANLVIVQNGQHLLEIDEATSQIASMLPILQTRIISS